MKVINVNTKIGYILKQHPDALEAIISISPKFNKLRNPLLRKLMASRTSINMASKIGGCSVDDFFEKLQALGFVVDRSVGADEDSGNAPIPDFMKNVSTDNVIELDVRPMLNEGKDPLYLIREKVKDLTPKQVLKLLNSFEPIPLIELLKNQGFESYTEIVNENLIITYFHRLESSSNNTASVRSSDDWDSVLTKFNGNLTEIDVRHLEMPLPMLTILDELEHLPIDKALYVNHKRIPVFLLPELQERKYDYRIKEVSDGEVYLLIFKA
ncbi:MAG TPA: DUF2249 domain-containing protein [Candidatus Kapabacteria bacterium]|nr:DUF2249 domain-containing protein [Candidatus Kapabacteria bacterium]